MKILNRKYIYCIVNIIKRHLRFAASVTKIRNRNLFNIFSFWVIFLETLKMPNKFLFSRSSSRWIFSFKTPRFFPFPGQRELMWRWSAICDLWSMICDLWQRWANSVLMTEYEYEYYSTFQKWPNTNTNIIRFEKGDRIRIRILFALKKATEYEYEYYSVWKNRPNTNTNIIWLEKIVRIRIRILV